MFDAASEGHEPPSIPRGSKRFRLRESRTSCPKSLVDAGIDGHPKSVEVRFVKGRSATSSPYLARGAPFIAVPAYRLKRAKRRLSLLNGDDERAGRAIGAHVAVVGSRLIDVQDRVRDVAGPASTSTEPPTWTLPCGVQVRSQPFDTLVPCRTSG